MNCCAVGTNGCLDLRHRTSALDGRMSAEWNRCPGSSARPSRDSVAPFATKLSRLDACENGNVVSWCRTQTSNHNSQGVVDGGVDKTGVSTTAPDRSAVL